MITLKNSQDIKNFFKENNFNIFGIAADAFNRLYFNDFNINYHIIALKNNLETDQIKKNFNVFCLEEKIGNTVYQISLNGASIIKNIEVQKYINSFTKPYVISYKGRSDFEDICEQNKWISSISSSKVNEYLENKVNFRKFLIENSLSYIEGYISKLAELNFNEIEEKLGLPFVIQYPESSGGRGTFFIDNLESFTIALQRLEAFEQEKLIDTVSITKFIKGRQVSISAIATRWGTLTSNLQFQILGVPELLPEGANKGKFCGHDWSRSKFINKDINNEAIILAKRFGDLIYKKLGYRGFFGLDIIIEEDTNKIYIIECNPRLTGALPTLDLIQFKDRKVQMIPIHLLEFIAENEKDLKFNLDIDSIEADVQDYKEGCHFFVFSKSDNIIKINSNLKPGIYSLLDNQMKYIRQGYRLNDLENNNEFIITEISSDSWSINKGNKICRVLALNGFFNQELKINNNWQTVVKEIFKLIN